MMLMTQAGFAKHIGVTKQYVNELVRKGVVELTSEKKVNVEKAKAAIDARKDPHREQQREGNKKQKDLLSEAGSYPSRADMSDEERQAQEAQEREEKRKELEELNKLSEKAGLPKEALDIYTMNVKELNQAILQQELRLKKAKADEGEKMTVPVEQVEKSVFAAVRIVRDGMLGIPARLAPKLSSITDIHTVRTLLETEINAQLSNLSKVFENE